MPLGLPDIPAPELVLHSPDRMQLAYVALKDKVYFYADFLQLELRGAPLCDTSQASAGLSCMPLLLARPPRTITTAASS